MHWQCDSARYFLGLLYRKGLRRFISAELCRHSPFQDLSSSFRENVVGGVRQIAAGNPDEDNK